MINKNNPYITTSKNPEDHCIRCRPNTKKKKYKGCRCKCHKNNVSKLTQQIEMLETLIKREYMRGQI